VWFNLPAHRKIEENIRTSCHPVFNLGDKTIIAKLVDGPFGTQVTVGDYRESGVPFVRVGNCRTGVLCDEDLVFIEEHLHHRLSRSEVLPNDVLFTKTGHILGYTAVFPKTFPRGNMSSHLVMMRPTERLLPDFLATYLRTNLGQDQVYRWGQKATKPELNTIEIRRFLIPVPETAIQKKMLVDLHRATHDRDAKLAQADALLNGIDDLVLAELGLPKPTANNRLAYAVRLNGIKMRLNAEYYHPERVLAVRAMEQAKGRLKAFRLEEIADFLRESVPVSETDHYLGLASIEPNTGELTDYDETATGQAFSFQKDDVLFSRLRPYLNKVRRAEAAGICSTEFYVMRIKQGLSYAVLPEYLACVLRSSPILAQTRRMMTGNTHPRLANEDVINLVVPIPDEPAQRRLVDDVAKRKEQVRRVRAEAASLWTEALKNFESELLAKGAMG
jgi:restriction endonuclease S subunit